MNLMKFAYRQLFLVFFIGTSIFSFGQITVKGMVMHRHKGLCDALITAEGVYTVSDSLGLFTLKLDSLGQTIRISKFHYKSQTVKVINSNFLTVVIKRRFFARRKMVVKFCFAKETKILLSDSTLKNIEEIKVGEKILNVNTDGFTLQQDEVLQIDSVVHDEIIELKLDNQSKIYSTTDHPYYIVGKGWCSFKPLETFEKYAIETKMLLAGDKCLTYINGKLLTATIVSIRPINKKIMTYNISELTHNSHYFANGILVGTEKINLTKP